jgi:hypothetical protein
MLSGRILISHEGVRGMIMRLINKCAVTILGLLMLAFSA